MAVDTAGVHTKWFEDVVVKEEEIDEPAKNESVNSVANGICWGQSAVTVVAANGHVPVATVDPLCQHPRKEIVLKEEGDLKTGNAFDHCKLEGCSDAKNLEAGEFSIKEVIMDTAKNDQNRDGAVQTTDVDNTEIRVKAEPLGWPELTDPSTLTAVKAEQLYSTEEADCQQSAGHAAVDDSEIQLKEEPRDWIELTDQSAFVEANAEAPGSFNVIKTDPLSFDGHEISTGLGPFTVGDVPIRKNQRKNSQNKPQKRDNRELKYFACNSCDFKTTKQRNLMKHANRHIGEKPYACEICDKKCLNKCGFVRNCKFRTRKKLTYTCDSCDFRTYRESNLHKHKMVQHASTNLFPCDVCDYSSHSQKFLAFHMRLHTGINFLECKFCRRSFQNFQSMKRHMRKHVSIDDMLQQLSKD